MNTRIDIYEEIENQNLDKAHKAHEDHKAHKAQEGLAVGVEEVQTETETETADLSDHRNPRTAEDMALEALELRLLFPDNKPSE